MVGSNGYEEIAVSSRIRLARNVNGIAFPQIRGEEKLKAIIKPVCEAVKPMGLFKIYPMSRISELEANVLKEKHLISADLIKCIDAGWAVIREDERISVMVNEEDHIRLQSILDGLKLDEAFFLADKADDLLSEKIDYAFDRRLGYITACPTNVGTGMRASVMLFLPALTITGQIKSIVNAVGRERITVRGVYGEGSSSDGSNYQLSNQVSIGLLEQDILRHVDLTVRNICEAERVAREELMNFNGIELKDRIKRSYGILTNCVKLDTVEFMRLLSDVKLGSSLGILPRYKAGVLDDMMVKVQPAHLQLAAGRELTPLERDISRADYVGSILRT